MKQRYLRRPFDGQNDIQYLQQNGFSPALSRALCARGVNQGNFCDYFGNTVVWHDPFEMANMSEAVETIRYLLDCGGSVLIYGDYDADGLTASSILSLFFTDNGIENQVIIPTRDEGYGVHAQNVFRAFERNYYDLVITVDCGISNAEEIRQITEELGVEVIVTDHHELPETLPNCICVNPKLGYPFPYLSGAGVAWKLVEALSDSQTALKYSDLACIGTIGDIMPMQDENRSIVKFGLTHWNHKSLNKLAELSGCGTQLTCSDVAMKIAPKINAAGRVGSPEAALDLLLCRDRADTAKANRLLALNDTRKKMLDAIVCQSDEMCDTKRIMQEKMVFLYSEDWAHGLLGIVAARYKEKYKLPALVMTRDGDNYVGSARGIDSLNLFDLFTKCSGHLVKFGGHKASVGFTVAKENLQNLRNAMAQALNDLDGSCFDKYFYYDIDLNGDATCQDVLALSQKLQPLLPQDKIICKIRDTVQFANAFGKEDAHLSATLSSGLEIKGFFKYGCYAPYIKNGAEVELICSLEIDSYTKNVCGIIEDMVLLNSTCYDNFYKLNLLKNFVLQPLPVVDTKEVDKILQGESVCALFDDYETYLECCQKYDFSQYFVDIFFDNSVSNKTVAVSPLEGYDYAKYASVLYFTPNKMQRNLPGYAKVVLVEPANVDLYALELSRQICLSAYTALKNKNKFDSIKSTYDKYLLNKISYAQYLVAIRVFEQIGLIKVVDKYTVQFDNSQKYDLTDSVIFKLFATKQ